MQLFKQCEKQQAAEAQHMDKRGGKRLCALVLTLVLLLELSGAVPRFLISPLVTEASAANAFTYQIGSLDAAVLPRNDVLSFKKVRELEAQNPNIVLDINSKFYPKSSTNLVTDKNLNSAIYGTGNWSVKYLWNPKHDSPAIASHLLHEAMDLELFWSGSYTRYDNADPRVKFWYYGDSSYNKSSTFPHPQIKAKWDISHKNIDKSVDLLFGDNE